MTWWRAGKRPQEPISELDPHRQQESEPVPPQKEDRILVLQRSLGNQAVQKLLPRKEGEPIAEEPRQNLEAAFGRDLSEVRVHRDPESAELATQAGANAFTAGRDIYFAPGAYGPPTLAHEVTHVVQQAQAASLLPSEESSLEHEAGRASSAVMAGEPAKISHAAAAPAFQRQPASGFSPPPIRLLPTYWVTLDSFATDSSDLTDQHQQQLDGLSERLKNVLSSAPDTFVNIVGFADAPGTEVHNLALGQERADAVLQYLAAKGVPVSMLHASSLGEELPRVETKKHEARNRRVEINIFERSFFKPSLGLPPLQPKAPAPMTFDWKPTFDLGFHPKIHIPTPEEEEQENFKRNEENWKRAHEILEWEKTHAPAGTSVSDIFGRAGRQLAKGLGLPKWAQDRVESIFKGLPTTAAKSVIDQIAAEKGFNQKTKEALKTAAEVLMKTEIK